MFIVQWPISAFSSFQQYSPSQLSHQQPMSYFFVVLTLVIDAFSFILHEQRGHWLLCIDLFLFSLSFFLVPTSPRMYVELVQVLCYGSFPSILERYNDTTYLDGRFVSLLKGATQEILCVTKSKIWGELPNILQLAILATPRSSMSAAIYI